MDEEEKKKVCVINENLSGTLKRMREEADKIPQQRKTSLSYQTDTGAVTRNLDKSIASLNLTLSRHKKTCPICNGTGEAKKIKTRKGGIKHF